MVFLFGAGFAESGHLLAILGFAFLVWFGPPYGVVFVAMGKESINFRVSALCAVVNVALNFIFIPKYGPTGAALTTLATYMIMKACYAHLCRKHLGSIFINTGSILPIALCALLAFALSAAPLHVIPAGVIFCIIYGAVTYRFILSEPERALCKRLIGTLKSGETAA